MNILYVDFPCPFLNDLLVSHKFCACYRTIFTISPLNITFFQFYFIASFFTHKVCLIKVSLDSWKIKKGKLLTPKILNNVIFWYVEWQILSPFNIFINSIGTFIRQTLWVEKNIVKWNWKKTFWRYNICIDNVCNKKDKSIFFSGIIPKNLILQYFAPSKQ